MKAGELLQIHLDECDLHSRVLEQALVEAASWLPFTAESVESVTTGQLRVLDQVAYRFTKLQDTMGRQVLPQILDLAQEPIPPEATFAEKLNWLEKMGALRSAEEWKELRVARNAIAHEYPDEPDLRAGALNRFLADAKRLNTLYESVRKYVSEHFPGVAAACE
ncbi:MAG: hypothetical protein HY897_22945 [Deltaproteobacteria bacterium]|nr:hypothetical protein [Deltaproteobacteria bacterium]